MDNNGDGQVDEGLILPVDADGDGFGDPKQSSCRGVSVPATDCDDQDAEVYPGAEEWCDGRHTDCISDGSDAGLATWEPVKGERIDVAKTLAAGSPGAPVLLRLDAVGTLHLCTGTWYLSLASVVDGLAVRGHGDSVVDGGGAARLVTATGSLELAGLTLRGGDGVDPEGGTATDGGAVYVEGSTLRLEDVWFEDNHADGAGGGLYAAVDQLEVVGGGFVGNTAESGGGAWVEAHAGEATGARSWRWTGTTFEANTALLGGGLATLVEGEGALTLEATSFDSNVGQAAGGGALLQCATGATCQLDVVGGAFSAGVTKGVGGDLYAEAIGAADLSLTVDAATFTGSRAAGGGSLGIYAEHAGPVRLDVTGSVFRGAAASNGGAVLVEAGSATVAVTLGGGSRFEGNEAVRGGVLYLAADGPESTLALGPVELVGNTSDAEGGALYVFDASARCEGARLAQNVAGGLGGAAYLYDATLVGAGCGLAEEGPDDNLGAGAPDDVMGLRYGDAATFLVTCARASCTAE